MLLLHASIWAYGVAALNIVTQPTSAQLNFNVKDTIIKSKHEHTLVYKQYYVMVK